MKKTLVALAVAASAATAVSTANAAVVYEQDGAKVELSGSFRAFLGRVSDDKRGDLINDDSRVIIKASQDLGNGLSAFGGYELRFNSNSGKNDEEKAANDAKNTFNNPTTNKLYGGLKHNDIGALSFGRQATNADDVVQDNGYYDSGELNPLTTSAKKSIKFRSAEWNGFSFGLDYLFGDSSKDRTALREDTLKNGYAASVFYNYALAEDQALDFAAVYSEDRFDRDTTAAVTKDKKWAAHVGYTFGPANFNFTYGQGSHKEDSETTDKGRYSIVQASYQITEPSRIFAHWERYQLKDGATGDSESLANKYLVGVDYKLHKNVVTYVQYAHKRVKDYSDNTTTKDNQYGVGLRVFF